MSKILLDEEVLIDKENIENGFLKMELDFKKEAVKNVVELIFVLPNKKEIIIYANKGDTILEVAKKNNLPIDGACGGSLACSTCHIVIEESYFKGDIAKKTEEEEEMLDNLANLKRTSRLGCQVIVTQEMNGMHIYLYNDGNFNICSECECCKG